MCVRTHNSDHIVAFLRGVVKSQRALRVSAVHKFPIWREGKAHHFTSVQPVISKVMKNCIVLSYCLLYFYIVPLTAVVRLGKMERSAPFVVYILMFNQQLGAGDIKDSDHARAEATREDVLARVEGHGARAVLRRKIIQLNTENKRHSVKQYISQK